MKKGSDPSILFETLAAIEDQYVGIGAVSETDLIAIVLDVAATHSLVLALLTILITPSLVNTIVKLEMAMSFLFLAIGIRRILNCITKSIVHCKCPEFSPPHCILVDEVGIGWILQPNGEWKDLINSWSVGGRTRHIDVCYLFRCEMKEKNMVKIKKDKVRE